MSEFIVAGKSFKNRLILGTGKYKDFATMKACYEASGTEMVTLAVRRFDLSAKGEENILNWIPKSLALLPNTAGCYTCEEALRVSRLAREALDTTLIKLEVIGDPNNLYPDNEETLKASAILVKEGFTVLPYVNADPILAKKLADVGCAAVMPLGSAIGSGQGVQNPLVLLLIRETLAPYKIPMIVDAGVGTASDAAIAMELGADAVLLNTAVAEAQDPITMARAMDHAVKAGRLAFTAGRMAKRLRASASSPMVGLVGK
jgi:thiazole synthase